MDADLLWTAALTAGIGPDRLGIEKRCGRDAAPQYSAEQDPAKKWPRITSPRQTAAPSWRKSFRALIASKKK